MTGLCFRAPLGAILLLALAATPALAGKAVTSAAMSLREGPGDSFTELAHISAGSLVDLRECNTRQWCHVYYGQLDGWVHVRGVEQANRRGSGGERFVSTADGGSSGGTATQDGSNDGGSKGSGGRGRHEGSQDSGNSGGGNGISAIDGASLPGSDSGGGGGSNNAGPTPGDRMSFSPTDTVAPASKGPSGT